MNSTNTSTSSPSTRFARMRERFKKFVEYCVNGVWSDTRKNWKVSVVKTLNLTVRSFINPDFQNLAAAMTYRTVLAIVPILALLFAICRGFGFDNLLQNQLYQFFPSQREALSASMKFVDSYLSQASEGVFVGVGIVFLLWTVISLLSNVEDSFNIIWNVKQGRTFWRKVTDYLGIFIVLPTLIICSSGITLILDTTMRKLLPFDFLSPAITFLFEATSVVLTWLFFAGTYILIPVAKVKFKNAMIAGALAGTAYCVLQWLFVSGQMYVAKYNAIYGSFSFIPLMLIWMQLVWLFTFIGATVCYASQNFDRFNFQSQIKNISLGYYQKTAVALAVVVCKRFQAGLPAMNAQQLSEDYHIPLLLAEDLVRRLVNDGILVNILDGDGKNSMRVIPGIDVDTLSLGRLLRIVIGRGSSDFIPGFTENFAGVESTMNQLTDDMLSAADKILLTNVDIRNL